MTLHPQPITGAAARRTTRKLAVWPIRTEEDYDRAAAVVDQLAIQPEGSLSPEDQDRLEIFTELIAAYDAAHHRIDTSSLTPIDLLKHLMEQRDMSASDLGRLLGNRQTGSELLSGRRQLSKAHIRKLSEFFHLSPEAFF